MHRQERYNFRATRVSLPPRMHVSGAMCILPTAERTAKYAGELGAAATLIKSEEGVLYPDPSDCRQKLGQ